jgi:O-succinylbenzoic acid--CoA ligase
VGGLAVLLRSAIAGTTVVLHPRFDAAAVVHALLRDRITMVSLVPTMLARVLDRLDGRPPALRCVLVGGAGAPPHLLAAARAQGLPVAPTYGLTEAASQVATLAPGEPADEPGDVGAPLWPTEVRIADDGEILVRGPTVAPACVAADGWLHTGDAGRLSPGGRLVVRGRRDDVIVTGGENVDPAEVEAALARHPLVAEVAVAGRPDPEWGQAVVAWVVPRGGARLTLAELREACRPWLAPYKLPRRLILVDALPRTASGKVRRQALSDA